MNFDKGINISMQQTTFTAVNALSPYYWEIITSRLNGNGTRTVFIYSSLSSAWLRYQASKTHLINDSQVGTTTRPGLLSFFFRCGQGGSGVENCLKKYIMLMIFFFFPSDALYCFIYWWFLIYLDTQFLLLIGQDKTIIIIIWNKG